MSDLIKMLEAKIIDVENARGPAKHILNDRLADLGQVAWDYGDETISALRDQETLRKIERMTKENGCTTITYLKSVDRWEIYTYKTGRITCSEISDILSLAVDAAVGANEKGGK